MHQMFINRVRLALKVQQDSTSNLFYGSPVSSVTVTQPSCFPEVVILDWYGLISCPGPTHSKGNGSTPLSTFLVGLHLILARCCAIHGLSCWLSTPWKVLNCQRSLFLKGEWYLGIKVVQFWIFFFCIFRTSAQWPSQTYPNPGWCV